MSNTQSNRWYIVGFLRPIPGVLSFVFPVIQNENVPDSMGVVALSGGEWILKEPSHGEDLVRVQPVALPKAERLQDLLPLFAYEFLSGSAWFGDACEISKVLIEFASGNQGIGDDAREEIARFVSNVTLKRYPVCKEVMLLQAGETPGLRRQSTARTVVFGVGDGAGNVIEQMNRKRPKGFDFIYANSDIRALERSANGTEIQLGKSGLGAGASAEAGREMAEEVAEDIHRALVGSQVVFLVACLGGRTGTGASSVIARIAHDMGIFTIALVTTPFDFEGRRRAKCAADGIVELQTTADGVIVFPNEKLVDCLGDDVSQEAAFAAVNDTLLSVAMAIDDIVRVPGLINVDIEDLKVVLQEPGKLALGMAVASGTSRAIEAAEAAASSPLLDGADLSKARGILVVISASRGTFKLSEGRIALATVRKVASANANVIFGTTYDDSLGEQMRVTILATGMSTSRRMLRVLPNTLGLTSAIDGNLSVKSDGGSDDDEILSVPGIWRSPRTSEKAAVQRVEMLRSLGEEGIEIPAFLRKQAD